MTFDLDKDTADIKFTLEKENLADIVAEVMAVIDVSQSMQGLFEGFNSPVQQALQRVIPIALNFDDNGHVPVYLFSHDATLIGKTLTGGNYKDFIDEEVLPIASWGGTSLLPVITEVIKDLGFVNPPKTSFLGFLSNVKKLSTLNTKSDSGLPAIVYVFTDGENDDKTETMLLLNSLATQRSEVYFNFIGIGETKFTFLTHAANILPNVGFTHMKDFANASAETIYAALIPAELKDWLRNAAGTAR